MAAADTSSSDDKDFLAKCEEEFKDRFTEKDEEFMKVFNLEPSIPPIIESWWVSQNSGRRNDRRNNRRSHPYERQSNNRDRDYKDRRDSNDRRGYSDYNRGYDDRGHGYGHRQQRPRYN